ncbi:nuclear transport factor 2 family protein [Aeromicrobium sp. UC242_57]|uniref:nuclear transport factor 2 family protein n=1 Tax=Aeromicrobium sp. UC242_57 TaxID=3374624 RepID=UPI0037AF88DB
MNDQEKLDLAQTMFAAWDAMDWDAVTDLFAENGVLHSVMHEPLVGKDAVGERIALLGSKATSMKLQIEALGVIGGRVFVQRVDVFDFDGNHGEVPVVGIMSMEDGKVTEWLEYYDRPTLLAGMGIKEDFGH